MLAMFLDFAYFVIWVLLQGVIARALEFARLGPDDFQYAVWIQTASNLATLIPVIAVSVEDVTTIVLEVAGTIKHKSREFRNG